MSLNSRGLEARQTSISVPAELQNEVTGLGLRKGEFKLAVRIKAGSDYAYTQYQALEKREPFAQYPPQYGTSATMRSGSTLTHSRGYRHVGILPRFLIVMFIDTIITAFLLGKYKQLLRGSQGSKGQRRKRF